MRTYPLSSRAALLVAALFAIGLLWIPAADAG